MSIFNYKQRNTIILVSIIALGCFILYALSNLFSSILGAIVLFTIFRPFYLYLVEKREWKRSVAALLIIISSLIVIVLPFIAISFMVIGKIAAINTNDLPIQQWMVKIDNFALTTFKQPNFAENTLQKLSTYATDLFPSLIGSAANIILTLLVLYFLLYFMFVQIKEFEAALLRYAPFREQYAIKFAQALRDSTYSNVLGQGIIAVVQGGLLANGFWIAGIPDPVFWGVIGAFISFLPVVGAPTLCIPAALFLFANHQALQGVLLLAYGLLFIGN
ncbi:MAG TPA: AI-2E family transporter, partial [Mucilaginibacter sp.]|nr:AI-2E family transporter [Mucilaginibacter sp.]